VENQKNRLLGEFVRVAKTQKHPRLRLRGSCEDALGQTLPIDEVVDIHAYLEMRRAARAIGWVEEDAGKKSAAALEGIHEELKELRRHVTKRTY